MPSRYDHYGTVSEKVINIDHENTNHEEQTTPTKAQKSDLKLAETKDKSERF